MARTGWDRKEGGRLKKGNGEERGRNSRGMKGGVVVILKAGVAERVVVPRHPAERLLLVRAESGMMLSGADVAVMVVGCVVSSGKADGPVLAFGVVVSGAFERVKVVRVGVGGDTRTRDILNEGGGRELVGGS